MDAMTYKPFIRDSFLFQRLSIKDFEAIYKTLPDSTLIAKGECVFSDESQGKALGLLLSGELRVYRTGADGKEKLHNRLLPGDAVGVAMLYGGTNFVSNVRAYKESEVLLIPETQLTNLWKQYPEVNEAFIIFLTERIRFLNRAINVQGGSQTQEKVEKYLRSCATESGEVQLPCSLSGIASRLNMGRSSLYRALDDLVAKGIVKRVNKKIYIQERNEE